MTTSGAATRRTTRAFPSSRSASVACVLARIHCIAETSANRISKPVRRTEGRTEETNKQTEERQETTDGKRSITRFPDPPLGARLCIFALRGGASYTGNCIYPKQATECIVGERRRTWTKKKTRKDAVKMRSMKAIDRERGREEEAGRRGRNHCWREKAARLSANFWETGKSW